MSASFKPSRAVASRSAYSVPRHPASVDLRLDGNEGLGASRDLLDVLGNADPEVLLRQYPSKADLTALIAKVHGVSTAQLLVTAGADDALDRACRALLQPGRQLLFPSPSFEMIPRYAGWAGGEVTRVPWPASAAFPTAEVLETTTDRTALICVVSPNNPTGATATADDLKALSAGAPNAVILLDHAYVEFADEDLTNIALTLPNVLVFRTLSKAWGLAGLRVGYVMGPQQLIQWMNAAGNPYTVTAPSSLLAAHRLRTDQGKMQAFVEQVREEREQLLTLLSDLGCEAHPSQGNFIFCRTPRASFLRDALASLGIGVRAWPGHPDLGDAVRITCPGDAEDFQRLREGLTAALAPQALLLDMDGVIADVSESYREAIIQTCAAYGVTIDLGVIHKVKAAGNANNDWVVSQRILAEHGIDLPLSDVTQTFEDLYHGTESAPGLKTREALIPEAAALRALAEKIPTAIVTGRPRSDAEEFLERFNLRDLFSVMVTMEDGPAKPNPAPVLNALGQLGLTRAWMVGDTIDDLKAAKAAGVVSFGVVPPKEDPERTTPHLLRSGAARVLASLEELTELLS